MICPKCGNKIYPQQMCCPYCKTSVEVIKRASNEQAKIALKNKEKEKVVLASFLPYDVSKKKLLLLSIFLGWAGAHCYYVGRMGRGFAMLLCFIVGLTFVSIPETWALHAYLSGIVAGIIGFACVFTWWMDIVRIIGNRFKVPVILLDRKEIKG